MSDKQRAKLNTLAQRDAALELVREIAASDPIDIDTRRCHFCDGREHYTGCIWEQARQIVKGD